MIGERTKTLSRRQALGVIGAAGAAMVACNGTPASPSAPATTTTTTAPTATSPACVVTPSETAGPFPSITLPVRSDVREDRQGTPLALAITVVNAGANCTPVANASVEIWHCDAAGNYSEYGTVSASTWLRGIQPVDSNGVARFTTIYPGWYGGRATHIHIEVFVNNRSVKTSQLAFPEEINSAVYATGVYAPRGQNPTKNDRDGIFADGFTSELATVTGSAAAGYNATFQVGITL